MVHKYLLRSARLRRVPSQFSWVDHRLVRDHHIERLSVEACALYLFLVTVGDAQGLSYYSDASVGRRLRLDPEALARARRDLLVADLIAFEAPLYQVLGLPSAARPPPRTAAVAAPQPENAPPQQEAQRRESGARHLAEILRELEGRR